MARSIPVRRYRKRINGKTVIVDKHRRELSNVPANSGQGRDSFFLKSNAEKHLFKEKFDYVFSINQDVPISESEGRKAINGYIEYLKQMGYTASANQIRKEYDNKTLTNQRVKEYMYYDLAQLNSNSLRIDPDTEKWSFNTERVEKIDKMVVLAARLYQTIEKSKIL
jgi:hypothetical protein